MSLHEIDKSLPFKDYCKQVRDRKKPLKASLSDLRKRLDTAVSLYVRQRDKRKNSGMCLICNKRPIQLAYHLIPRKCSALRWNLQNVVGACGPCNWAEKNNRLKYRQKHIDIFGRDLYENLEAQSHLIVKHSTSDIRSMLSEIEEKLARGMD